jgi:hypothetical protein
MGRIIKLLGGKGAGRGAAEAVVRELDLTANGERSDKGDRHE